jgi:hypothetical protein
LARQLLHGRFWPISAFVPGSLQRRSCEPDKIGDAAGGAALFALAMMLAQSPVRLGRYVLANLALKKFVHPR